VVLDDDSEAMADVDVGDFIILDDDPGIVLEVAIGVVVGDDVKGKALQQSSLASNNGRNLECHTESRRNDCVEIPQYHRQPLPQR
jgi:hypothetical protein